MKQAMDALNGCVYRNDSVVEAIAALKAALKAELAKPEQDYIKKLEDDYRKQLDELSQRNYELRRALAQPEQDLVMSGCCAECGVKASDGYALYCVNCTDLFAQPEHPLDKKADNARELGLDYEPDMSTNQQNVNTSEERVHKSDKNVHEPESLEYWNAVEGWVKIDEIRKHFDSVGCGTIYKTAGEGRKPLYTAPVSKPWVSLTELERCNLFKGVDWDTEDWGYLAYARAIEAACREKNGRTDSHTGGGATGSGRAWASGGVDES